MRCFFIYAHFFLMSVHNIITRCYVNRNRTFCTSKHLQSCNTIGNRYILLCCIWMFIGSTYKCETLSSKMTFLKNKYCSRSTEFHLQNTVHWVSRAEVKNSWYMSHAVVVLYIDVAFLSGLAQL